MWQLPGCSTETTEGMIKSVPGSLKRDSALAIEAAERVTARPEAVWKREQGGLEHWVGSAEGRGGVAPRLSPVLGSLRRDSALAMEAAERHTAQPEAVWKSEEGVSEPWVGSAEGRGGVAVRLSPVLGSWSRDSALTSEAAERVTARPEAVWNREEEGTEAWLGAGDGWAGACVCASPLPS